jgi:LPXTG-site transpeptidase (sortase) family protein
MGKPANRFRRTAILGILIGASGLLCLGSGLALLAWRLLAPEDAVLLPPGVVITPEDTPTPGVLGRPLPAPPLPPDPAQVVILPESELPTPTATGTLPPVSPSPRPSDTPFPSATFTPTAIPPTRTPAPVRTRIASTVAPALTATPAPTATPSLTPTAPPPAIPDRILIDAIGLNAPVVPVGQHAVRLGGQVYSQWDVPNVFAAGWHQNSAPLGQPGNTVINGHHNIHGEVFRYLVALEPGDVITLEAAGQRHYYLVAQTMTLAEQSQPVDVRRENARWILPTRDERVTLITCWPYSANTHRLVVIAQPAWALGLPAELP